MTFSFGLPMLELSVYKKALVLAFSLIYFCHGVDAQEHGADQTGGKISGTVIDSATKEPVAYSSVGLEQIDTKKEVNGTTTDDNGAFHLNNIPDGTYRLVVYFVGYQTGYKNGIIINSTTPEIVLTNFKLVNKQATLKEVIVTADKSLIENKIDKMVYNAENDLTSQGGVATDILKKVPLVSVDVDGNVELQGNSNIRFLINGKPSSIFGNNLTDVLQSIPASQIKSIEVITSPGAKYDAEGTGGIINIILKKVTAQGVNGNLSLSGGTRLENGSFNLTARKGHFGAHAFLSGNAQLTSTTLNSMNRTSQTQDPVTMQNQVAGLNQNGQSDFNRNGYQSGAGFDWEISPKDNISGGLNFNSFGSTNSGTAIRQTTLTDASGNLLSNTADAINTSNNSNLQTFDYNLDYKRTFKKEDQELAILFNSSVGNNFAYYKQSQEHLSPESVFNSSYGNNPGLVKETNIELNYVQPAGKGLIIEMGAKTVLDQIKSTSDVYLLNSTTGSYDYSSTQSSALTYNRNIYAGYLSATFKLFKFLDVKAGCRYEYTEATASFSSVGDTAINPYGSVVPSGMISHTFANNQTLKLSYSHRIQRPDYRDLNPFLNASDPGNITTGNLSLVPEKSNKIELGYNKTFDKGSTFVATLFARLNTDDIQSYTRFFPTYKIGDSTYSNVAVTSRENIGHENNLGANLFFSIPVKSKLTLRSNVSGFERYIITGLGSGGDVHGFNYRVKLNASYEVSSSLSVEVYGNYNSPKVNAQGTMPAFATYNLAFRKQFFNKKFSVAATATNPFNKYIDQRTSLVGTNFTLNTDRQLPYRSFGVNLTYKFGKLEFKKQKDAEDPNLSEPSN
jgi:ferric enterobactin receptor